MIHARNESSDKIITVKYWANNTVPTNPQTKLLLSRIRLGKGVWHPVIKARPFMATQLKNAHSVLLMFAIEFLPGKTEKGHSVLNILFTCLIEDPVGRKITRFTIDGLFAKSS